MGDRPDGGAGAGFGTAGGRRCRYPRALDLAVLSGLRAVGDGGDGAGVLGAQPGTVADSAGGAAGVVAEEDGGVGPRTGGHLVAVRHLERSGHRGGSVGRRLAGRAGAVDRWLAGGVWSGGGGRSGISTLVVLGGQTIGTSLLVGVVVAYESVWCGGDDRRADGRQIHLAHTWFGDRCGVGRTRVVDGLSSVLAGGRDVHPQPGVPLGLDQAASAGQRECRLDALAQRAAPASIAGVGDSARCRDSASGARSALAGTVGDGEHARRGGAVPLVPGAFFRGSRRGGRGKADGNGGGMADVARVLVAAMVDESGGGASRGSGAGGHRAVVAQSGRMVGDAG